MHEEDSRKLATTGPWQRANADWMRDARWGVMTHYLADLPSSKEPADMTPEQWNRHVDGVDVSRFADTIAATGAGYLIFTLGQNSGFFCSPNETYDSLVGVKPSRLSRRDLMGEIAAALPNRYHVFDRFIGGAQFQVLTYLGDYWCYGQPRYPDALVIEYTQYINSFGGAVTWDVPIGLDGTIPEAFLRQLGALGREIER
jgi:hypothetical protein